MNYLTHKIVFLQPPSPPFMNVKRDYAGGMGVADPSSRPDYGHDRNYITLPYMSLLYCAAVTERNGLSTVFIDAQADNLNIEDLTALLTRTRPEILVAAVNLPSVYGDLFVLRTLRERIPGLRTVAVGTVTIPLYGEIAGSKAADAIVRGDPEAVLPGMLEALQTGGGQGFELRGGALTNTEPGRVRDLDALPDLPYHLVPIEKYRYHGFGRDTRYAAVFASRGCPFNCYYCPYPMGFGSVIAARKADRIADELQGLRDRHGVKGILFRDQVFTMDRERTIELCNEMLRRRLELKWVVETRLDRVDRPLLEKMKAAGCVRIHYGLESGDPKLFSRVGKDGAEGRLERLMDNFRMTEEIGIHPHMFILIGLTGEDHATIDRTIGVVRRLKPLTLQVAVVTPYPGTGLFDEVKRKGLLLTEDWSLYTGFNPVLRTESLSAEDLDLARRKIIGAQRRAVFWKRQRKNARLAARYLADGTLWRRVKRKME